MYNDIPDYFSSIPQPAGQSYPISNEEAWFSQYDIGQQGATAFPPLHMRNNPDESGPLAWFNKQEDLTKGLIVAGGVAVLGSLIYFIAKK